VKNNKTDGETEVKQKNALIAYPAQCNFSGAKYPLDWISSIKDGRLECISSSKSFYIELETLINVKTSPCLNADKSNSGRHTHISNA